MDPGRPAHLNLYETSAVQNDQAMKYAGWRLWRSFALGLWMVQEPETRPLQAGYYDPAWRHLAKSARNAGVARDIALQDPAFWRRSDAYARTWVKRPAERHREQILLSALCCSQQGSSAILGGFDLAGASGHQSAIIQPANRVGVRVRE